MSLSPNAAADTKGVTELMEESGCLVPLDMTLAGTIRGGYFAPKPPPQPQPSLSLPSDATSLTVKKDSSSLTRAEEALLSQQVTTRKQVVQASSTVTSTATQRKITGHSNASAAAAAVDNVETSSIFHHRVRSKESICVESDVETDTATAHETDTDDHHTHQPVTVPTATAHGQRNSSSAAAAVAPPSVPSPPPTTSSELSKVFASPLRQRLLLNGGRPQRGGTEAAEGEEETEEEKEGKGREGGRGGGTSRSVPWPPPQTASSSYLLPSTASSSSVIGGVVVVDAAAEATLRAFIRKDTFVSPFPTSATTTITVPPALNPVRGGKGGGEASSSRKLSAAAAVPSPPAHDSQKRTMGSFDASSSPNLQSNNNNNQTVAFLSSILATMAREEASRIALVNAANTSFLTITGAFLREEGLVVTQSILSAHNANKRREMFLMRARQKDNGNGNDVVNAEKDDLNDVDGRQRSLSGFVKRKKKKQLSKQRRLKKNAGDGDADTQLLLPSVTAAATKESEMITHTSSSSPIVTVKIASPVTAVGTSAFSFPFPPPPPSEAAVGLVLAPSPPPTTGSASASMAVPPQTSRHRKHLRISYSAEPNPLLTTTTTTRASTMSPSPSPSPHSPSASPDNGGSAGDGNKFNRVALAFASPLRAAAERRRQERQQQQQSSSSATAAAVSPNTVTATASAAPTATEGEGDDEESIALNATAIFSSKGPSREREGGAARQHNDEGAGNSNSPKAASPLAVCPTATEESDSTAENADDEEETESSGNASFNDDIVDNDANDGTSVNDRRQRYAQQLETLLTIKAQLSQKQTNLSRASLIGLGVDLLKAERLDRRGIEMEAVSVIAHVCANFFDALDKNNTLGVNPQTIEEMKKSGGFSSPSPSQQETTTVSPQKLQFISNVEQLVEREQRLSDLAQSIRRSVTAAAVVNTAEGGDNEGEKESPSKKWLLPHPQSISSFVVAAAVEEKGGDGSNDEASAVSSPLTAENLAARQKKRRSMHVDDDANTPMRTTAAPPPQSKSGVTSLFTDMVTGVTAGPLPPPSFPSSSAPFAPFSAATPSRKQSAFAAAGQQNLRPTPPHQVGRTASTSSAASAGGGGYYNRNNNLHQHDPEPFARTSVSFVGSGSVFGDFPSSSSPTAFAAASGNRIRAASHCINAHFDNYYIPGSNNSNTSDVDGEGEGQQQQQQPAASSSLSPLPPTTTASMSNANTTTTSASRRGSRRPSLSAMMNAAAGMSGVGGVGGVGFTPSRRSTVSGASTHHHPLLGFHMSISPTTNHLVPSFSPASVSASAAPPPRSIASTVLAKYAPEDPLAAMKVQMLVREEEHCRSSIDKAATVGWTRIWQRILIALPDSMSLKRNFSSELSRLQIDETRYRNDIAAAEASAWSELRIVVQMRLVWGSMMMGGGGGLDPFNFSSSSANAIYADEMRSRFGMSPSELFLIQQRRASRSPSVFNNSSGVDGGGYANYSPSPVRPGGGGGPRSRNPLDNKREGGGEGEGGQRAATTARFLVYDEGSQQPQQPQPPPTTNTAEEGALMVNSSTIVEDDALFDWARHTLIHTVILKQLDVESRETLARQKLVSDFERVRAILNAGTPLTHLAPPPPPPPRDLLADDEDEKEKNKSGSGEAIEFVIPTAEKITGSPSSALDKSKIPATPSPQRRRSQLLHDGASVATASSASQKRTATAAMTTMNRSASDASSFASSGGRGGGGGDVRSGHNSNSNMVNRTASMSSVTTPPMGGKTSSSLRFSPSTSAVPSAAASNSNTPTNRSRHSSFASVTSPQSAQALRRKTEESLQQLQKEEDYQRSDIKKEFAKGLREFEGKFSRNKKMIEEMSNLQGKKQRLLLNELARVERSEEDARRMLRAEENHGHQTLFDTSMRLLARAKGIDDARRRLERLEFNERCCLIVEKEMFAWLKLMRRFTAGLWFDDSWYFANLGDKFSATRDAAGRRNTFGGESGFGDFGDDDDDEFERMSNATDLNYLAEEDRVDDEDGEQQQQRRSMQQRGSRRVSDASVASSSSTTSRPSAAVASKTPKTTATTTSKKKTKKDEALLSTEEEAIFRARINGLVATERTERLAIINSAMFATSRIGQQVSQSLAEVIKSSADSSKALPAEKKRLQEVETERDIINRKAIEEVLAEEKFQRNHVIDEEEAICRKHLFEQYSLLHRQVNVRSGIEVDRIVDVFTLKTEMIDTEREIVVFTSLQTYQRLQVFEYETMLRAILQHGSEAFERFAFITLPTFKSLSAILCNIEEVRARSEIRKAEDVERLNSIKLGFDLVSAQSTASMLFAQSQSEKMRFSAASFTTVFNLALSELKNDAMELLDRDTIVMKSAMAFADILRRFNKKRWSLNKSAFVTDETQKRAAIETLSVSEFIDSAIRITENREHAVRVSITRLESAERLALSRLYYSEAQFTKEMMRLDADEQRRRGLLISKEHHDWLRLVDTIVHDEETARRAGMECAAKLGRIAYSIAFIEELESVARIDILNAETAERSRFCAEELAALQIAEADARLAISRQQADGFVAILSEYVAFIMTSEQQARIAIVRETTTGRRALTADFDLIGVQQQETESRAAIASKEAAERSRFCAEELAALQIAEADARREISSDAFRDFTENMDEHFSVLSRHAATSRVLAALSETVSAAESRCRSAIERDRAVAFAMLSNQFFALVFVIFGHEESSGRADLHLRSAFTVNAIMMSAVLDREEITRVALIESENAAHRSLRKLHRESVLLAYEREDLRKRLEFSADIILRDRLNWANDLAFEEESARNSLSNVCELILNESLDRKQISQHYSDWCHYFAASFASTIDNLSSLEDESATRLRALATAHQVFREDEEDLRRQQQQQLIDDSVARSASRMRANRDLFEMQLLCDEEAASRILLEQRSTRGFNHLFTSLCFSCREEIALDEDYVFNFFSFEFDAAWLVNVEEPLVRKGTLVRFYFEHGISVEEFWARADLTEEMNWAFRDILDDFEAQKPLAADDDDDGANADEASANDTNRDDHPSSFNFDIRSEDAVGDDHDDGEDPLSSKIHHHQHQPPSAVHSTDATPFVSHDNMNNDSPAEGEEKPSGFTSPVEEEGGHHHHHHPASGSVGGLDDSHSILGKTYDNLNQTTTSSRSKPKPRVKPSAAAGMRRINREGGAAGGGEIGLGRSIASLIAESNSGAGAGGGSNSSQSPSPLFAALLPSPSPHNTSRENDNGTSAAAAAAAPRKVRNHLPRPRPKAFFFNSPPATNGQDPLLLALSNGGGLGSTTDNADEEGQAVESLSSDKKQQRDANGTLILPYLLPTSADAFDRIINTCLQRLIDEEARDRHDGSFIALPPLAAECVFNGLGVDCSETDVGDDIAEEDDDTKKNQLCLIQEHHETDAALNDLVFTPRKSRGGGGSGNGSSSFRFFFDLYTCHALSLHRYADGIFASSSAGTSPDKTSLMFVIPPSTPLSQIVSDRRLSILIDEMIHIFVIEFSQLEKQQFRSRMLQIKQFNNHQLPLKWGYCRRNTAEADENTPSTSSLSAPSTTVAKSLDAITREVRRLLAAPLRPLPRHLLTLPSQRALLLKTALRVLRRYMRNWYLFAVPKGASAATGGGGNGAVAHAAAGAAETDYFNATVVVDTHSMVANAVSEKEVGGGRGKRAVQEKITASAPNVFDVDSSFGALVVEADGGSDHDDHQDDASNTSGEGTAARDGAAMAIDDDGVDEDDYFGPAGSPILTRTISAGLRVLSLEDPFRGRNAFASFSRTARSAALAAAASSPSLTNNNNNNSEGNSTTGGRHVTFNEGEGGSSTSVVKATTAQASSSASPLPPLYPHLRLPQSSLLSIDDESNAANTIGGGGGEAAAPPLPIFKKPSPTDSSDPPTAITNTITTNTAVPSLPYNYPLVLTTFWEELSFSQQYWRRGIVIPIANLMLTAKRNVANELLNYLHSALFAPFAAEKDAILSREKKREEKSIEDDRFETSHEINAHNIDLLDSPASVDAEVVTPLDGDDDNDKTISGGRKGPSMRPRPKAAGGSGRICLSDVGSGAESTPSPIFFSPVTAVERKGGDAREEKDDAIVCDHENADGVDADQNDSQMPTPAAESATTTAIPSSSLLVAKDDAQPNVEDALLLLDLFDRAGVDFGNSATTSPTRLCDHDEDKHNHNGNDSIIADDGNDANNDANNALNSNDTNNDNAAQLAEEIRLLRAQQEAMRAEQATVLDSLRQWMLMPMATSATPLTPPSIEDKQQPSTKAMATTTTTTASTQTTDTTDEQITNVLSITNNVLLLDQTHMSATDLISSCSSSEMHESAATSSSSPSPSSSHHLSPLATNENEKREQIEIEEEVDVDDHGNNGAIELLNRKQQRNDDAAEGDLTDQSDAIALLSRMLSALEAKLEEEEKEEARSASACSVLALETQIFIIRKHLESLKESQAMFEEERSKLLGANNTTMLAGEEENVNHDDDDTAANREVSVSTNMRQQQVFGQSPPSSAVAAATFSSALVQTPRRQVTTTTTTTNHDLSQTTCADAENHLLLPHEQQQQSSPSPPPCNKHYSVTAATNAALLLVMLSKREEGETRAIMGQCLKELERVESIQNALRSEISNLKTEIRRDLQSVKDDGDGGADNANDNATVLALMRAEHAEQMARLTDLIDATAAAAAAKESTQKEQHDGREAANTAADDDAVRRRPSSQALAVVAADGNVNDNDRSLLQQQQHLQLLQLQQFITDHVVANVTVAQEANMAAAEQRIVSQLSQNFSQQHASHLESIAQLQDQLHQMRFENEQQTREAWEKRDQQEKLLSRLRALEAEETFERFEHLVREDEVFWSQRLCPMLFAAAADDKARQRMAQQQAFMLHQQRAEGEKKAQEEAAQRELETIEREQQRAATLLLEQEAQRQQLVNTCELNRLQFVLSPESDAFAELLSLYRSEQQRLRNEEVQKTIRDQEVARLAEEARAAHIAREAEAFAVLCRQQMADAESEESLHRRRIEGSERTEDRQIIIAAFFAELQRVHQIEQQHRAWAREVDEKETHHQKSYHQQQTADATVDRKDNATNTVDSNAGPVAPHSPQDASITINSNTMHHSTANSTATFSSTAFIKSLLDNLIYTNEPSARALIEAREAERRAKLCFRAEENAGRARIKADVSNAYKSTILIAYRSLKLLGLEESGRAAIVRQQFRQWWIDCALSSEIHNRITTMDIEDDMWRDLQREFAATATTIVTMRRVRSEAAAAAATAVNASLANMTTLTTTSVSRHQHVSMLSGVVHSFTSPPPFATSSAVPSSSAAAAAAARAVVVDDDDYTIARVSMIPFSSPMSASSPLLSSSPVVAFNPPAVAPAAISSGAHNTIAAATKISDISADGNAFTSTSFMTVNSKAGMPASSIHVGSGGDVGVVVDRSNGNGNGAHASLKMELNRSNACIEGGEERNLLVESSRPPYITATSAATGGAFAFDYGAAVLPTTTSAFTTNTLTKINNDSAAAAAAAAASSFVSRTVSRLSYVNANMSTTTANGCATSAVPAAAVTPVPSNLSTTRASHLRGEGRFAVAASVLVNTSTTATTVGEAKHISTSSSAHYRQSSHLYRGSRRVGGSSAAAAAVRGGNTTDTTSRAISSEADRLYQNDNDNDALDATITSVITTASMPMVNNVTHSVAAFSASASASRGRSPAGGMVGTLPPPPPSHPLSRARSPQGSQQQQEHHQLHLSSIDANLRSVSAASRWSQQQQQQNTLFVSSSNTNDFTLASGANGSRGARNRFVAPDAVARVAALRQLGGVDHNYDGMERWIPKANWGTGEQK